MASLADVVDDPTMGDLDDAPMEETEDMTGAAEAVMSAIKSGDASALKDALEEFILSVK